jgi:AraC-like DNA-binding protein
MDQYTLNDINPYILQCSYMDTANCPPPGTHFGIRCVKWFEIELILSGEGRIVTNGKDLQTERGSLFFRTPGMMVNGVLPYASYIILFDPIKDTIRIPEYKNKKSYNLSSEEGKAGGIPFVRSVKGLELPPVMKVANVERYREVFEKIHSAFLFHSIHNQFVLKSLLLQLLIMATEEWSYISKNHSTNRSIRKNTPSISKVKDHIDRNTQKNFKLEQLAAMADLSPSFFCKLFKRIVGVSPISYINANKIYLAKKMLTKTNMSVKEISIECGFENDTYFFTLFKSQLGISPLHFREKYGMPALFSK